MSWPPTPGTAPVVDLDFSLASTTPTGPAPTVDLEFSPTGPPPEDAPITIAGVFAFSGTLLANVDAGVHRGISQQTAVPFGPAARLPATRRLPWQPTAPLQITQPLPVQPAASLRTMARTPWAPSQRAQATRALAWQATPTQSAQAAAVWAQAAVQRLLAQAAWQAAADAGGATAVVWQQAQYTRHTAHTPWQTAAALGTLARLGFDGLARSLGAQLVAPWQVASALHTQQSGPGFVRPARPVVPPPGALASLRFCALAWPGTPAGVPIVFGIDPCAPLVPQATLFILPARFYMAVHTLTAQHLPSLAPVPIFNVSMSADAGSFGWTFSASAPASVFEQLAPAAGLPAQIRITLDGIPFVFLVDSLQRQEAFGQRGVRIAGRSATALLARPYARETDRLNTSAKTAQQLAADALEFTGAALDWGLTDWLVPAGAWSHNGTPLAAVQAIVEAAGGYLQSHRSAATLLARHPYPELPGGVPGGPWNWGGVFAADVELAPDAIITAGIERRDGPDINGVYVSGTSQGVLALVKRTGTAANQLAGLITDPLITAIEAAQQRGLSVLGAAGPKHLVQIELPILSGAGQPGVLDVGQLVQVNEASPWRARVRSVSVNATMPKARQTVSLERHLETT